jgi:glycosyltransferase involved in cell wall biosynthesis
VTVVICVYNAGDLLRPSVESILNQTYSNLEVLVVDDGSTDDCVSTIDHLHDPRIRILRQENKGKPAAMNYALSELRGEFYAVQDADDLSLPQRIERQLQCMRDHPEVAAVYCGHELILDGLHIAPRFAAKDSARCRRDIAEMRMPAHDPTGMYRVSMVGQFRYDEKLRIAEGYDYILRIGEQFPMMVVGECLYAYRVNREGLTKRDPIARQKLLRDASRKMFERRGLPYDESQLPKVSDPDRITNRDLDDDLVSHFMASTVDLRRAGRWRAAARAAATCIALHPRDPYYYRPVLYTVAPLRLIEWYRTRKSNRRAATMESSPKKPAQVPHR